VVGGDYQGLGIARSLGRRGVEVAVLDDERSISRHSRYVSRHMQVKDLGDDAVTVEALLALARRWHVEGWVVYPTREETVAALARHRELLLEHFRVPTPPWQITRWAYDKRNTYRRATELGIPVPRMWRPGDEEQARAIDGTPPFVIKPAIKEQFLHATGRKAWRADTHVELVACVRSAARLVGPSEVLVQELVPGDGECQLAFCAFCKGRGAPARMVVRRLRQHPVEFGRASTFVETAHDAEVEELSMRFLSAIDYYGLVEVEYKRDARDGALKLLDVNARTWGYHSLGQRAGVDFPYILYADQVGLPMPRELRAPAGVSWVRLVTDVPTAMSEITARRLNAGAYLRSLASADTEAVFTRDDPLPGMAELVLLPYLLRKRGM
jgi:predicted ATP-grasp superfamily ATP-dependent carboligase